MRDIPDLFLSRIGTDAAFVTLTNRTGDGDPRIYRYYNSDAVIDDPEVDGSGPKPAYVTYALLASPGLNGGMKEPTYSFVIWARSVVVVEAVRDRLVALFDKRTLTTPAGRSVYVRLVHENDSFQEQPNYDGKTLHFRFGHLALAALLGEVEVDPGGWMQEGWTQ